MLDARSQRIGNILIDKNLIIPGKEYDLSEIYEIVSKNANLTKDDWEKEDNGDIKWQHTVRRLIQEWNGKRSVLGTRGVTYSNNRKYIFN